MVTGGAGIFPLGRSVAITEPSLPRFVMLSLITGRSYWSTDHIFSPPLAQLKPYPPSSLETAHSSVLHDAQGEQNQLRELLVSNSIL